MHSARLSLGWLTSIASSLLRKFHVSLLVVENWERLFMQVQKLDAMCYMWSGWECLPAEHLCGLRAIFLLLVFNLPMRQNSIRSGLQPATFFFSIFRAEHGSSDWPLGLLLFFAYCLTKCQLTLIRIPRSLKLQSMHFSCKLSKIRKNNSNTKNNLKENFRFQF